MIFEDRYTYNLNYMKHKPKQKYIKLGNMVHFIIGVWQRLDINEKIAWGGTIEVPLFVHHDIETIILSLILASIS